MKFVLTNDDGIDAPGLQALLVATEGLGARIVVAPESPRSGVGHMITTRSPIAVARDGGSRFAVDGTPVDCARVALTHLAKDAEWLIAGINRGGNLGVDFFPSGTIAAAREAALLGRRALAVSQFVERDREIRWEASARRAARVIRLLLERAWPDGYYWNVNLPHRQEDAEEPEIVFCPVDPSPMDVRFREEGSSLIYDGSYHDRPRLPGHDIDVCFSGSIAASLLPLDLNKGRSG